jgi:hypothetical protein
LFLRREVQKKVNLRHCVNSLPSVTFESNSKLHRIDESAFGWSGLKTIEIPASVEVVCKSCFYECKSLTSVTFESNSKLQRIEESAFAESDLRTIEIPASVEVVCKSCFYECTSLISVTFESNSKLHRIEESAFAVCSDLKSLISHTTFIQSTEICPFNKHRYISLSLSPASTSLVKAVIHYTTLVLHSTNRPPTDLSIRYSIVTNAVCFLIQMIKLNIMIEK